MEKEIWEFIDIKNKKLIDFEQSKLKPETNQIIEITKFQTKETFYEENTLEHIKVYFVNYILWKELNIDQENMLKPYYVTDFYQKILCNKDLTAYNTSFDKKSINNVKKLLYIQFPELFNDELNKKEILKQKQEIEIKFDTIINIFMWELRIRNNLINEDISKLYNFLLPWNNITNIIDAIKYTSRIKELIKEKLPNLFDKKWELILLNDNDWVNRNKIYKIHI